MIMKRSATALLLAFSLLAPNPSLIAQDEAVDDDIFELSPFSVSEKSARGYRAQNTLAGSRLNTSLKDVAASIHQPDLPVSVFGASAADFVGLDQKPLSLQNAAQPVTLVIKADEVVLNMAIGFFDDLEKVRKDKLYEYLDQVQAAIEKDPTLRFIPGEMRIAQGDRKKSRGNKSRAAYTSHAYFQVAFDLTDSLYPAKRIHEITRTLYQLGLESDVTRLYRGDIELLVKNPQQHRDALLQLVLRELNALRETLGKDFALTPTRIDDTVRVAAYSQTEVTLWIDYDYNLDSLQQKERKEQLRQENEAKESLRLSREHELAMAKATTAQPTCCQARQTVN